MDTITFLLAIVGYAGLTLTAVASMGRPIPRALWASTVAVIVVHVVMVWAVRYDWQFAEATRNGYFGFLLFHAALGAIVVSLFVGDALARTVIWLSFGVVSLGALGAVFTYDSVAAYRAPVVLLAVTGAIVGLVKRVRGR